MASVVKFTIASTVNHDVARLLSPSNDSGMALLPQLEDMEFIYGCGNDLLTKMASTRFFNVSCVILKTVVVNGVLFDLRIGSVFNRIFHSATSVNIH